MKFVEIIKENNNLGLQLIKSNPYNINVLSNITINQLKPVLEYGLREKGINAIVEIGDYDNIIQESVKLTKNNTVIIFWELININENFLYNIESYSDEKFEKLLKKIKLEITLLIDSLKHNPLILFNKFSYLNFNSFQLKKNKYEKLSDILNIFLIEKLTPNFRIIDIDKIFMQLSVNSCIDLRNFNSTKSMYTIDFFKNYVKYIIPIFQTAQGFVKKAIIFDCDNTLWGGVIGEDGIENIQLDETKKNGIYFKQVQLLAKQLLANGVVLGICSKNNFDDVIEVFEKSNTCTLKKDDFLIKKINWNDKSTNLKEISKELNIGIDSLIFVDDSEFEINLIKQQIPEIQTFIVPKNLSEYPIYFYNFIFSLFFNSSTKEDTIRLKSYHENLQRDSIKDNFSDIESYIKSLEIQIHLEIDKIENIERVAQLTQKTNQFNLTTKRYTTEQIKLLMSSKNSEIVTVNVIDKFGESGLTGVCILLIDVDTLTVEIDTLLLSCRILGRNIEIAFLEELISFYSQRGFKYIKSTFIKSPKNNQVENFFEKINFDLLNKNNLIKYYHFNLTNYIKSPITINYIKKEWKQE